MQTFLSLWNHGEDDGNTDRVVFTVLSSDALRSFSLLLISISVNL